MPVKARYIVLEATALPWSSHMCVGLLCCKQALAGDKLRIRLGSAQQTCSSSLVMTDAIFGIVFCYGHVNMLNYIRSVVLAT